MNYSTHQPGIGILQVLLLCLVSSIATSSSAAVPSSDAAADAVRVVRSFVEGEFSGEPGKRLELGAMTIHGRTLSGDTLNEGTYPGLITSYTADPIVVVSNFVVGEVSRSKEEIYISVIYDVEALTSGSGVPERRITAQKQFADTVKYRLVSINGAWRIINPPKPRVSIGSLRNIYATELREMAIIVAAPANSSDAQKAVYDHLAREKATLDKIANR